MDIPLRARGFCAIRCARLVRVNKNGAPSYLRPFAMRGYGEMGVNPALNPVEFYLAC